MQRVTAVLSLALCFWVAPRRAAAEVIREIEVIGNRKTTDNTVLLIAGIEEGDDWSTEASDRILRYLVNSGLFKDVDVYSNPAPGGVKVTIEAVDKHSWAVAPTFYNQPTNKGAGFGFGENNLFGENKKLLLYGQAATGDSFLVGVYLDPSLRSTRLHWQYDVYLRRSRFIEYAPPTSFRSDPKAVRVTKMNYFNSGFRGGITLFRGISLDLRLRGAFVFYEQPSLAEGAIVADVSDAPDVNEASLPKPGIAGWDLSSELLLQFDRRANWYGIRSGSKYSFSFERALPQLGSDFRYWHATASWERARKYFERHNLIINTMAGYGKNLPFQHEYTSGGTALRGYKNYHIRGNLKAAATFEYSLPLATIKGVALRGLAFFDSSYTAFVNAEENRDVRHYLPATGALGLAPFRNSLGVGTRLYVRQIVLPLLGLDLGYGLERGATEIYLAVGLADY